MNTASSSFYSVQTLLEQLQGDPNIFLKTGPGALCVFTDVVASASSFCVTLSSIKCLVSSFNNLLSISQLIQTDPDNNFQSFSDVNGIIDHIVLLIYERRKEKILFLHFSLLVCLFV